MHAFDLLAEAKMRQWQREVLEGKAKKPGNAEPVRIEACESFEKTLYRDIRKQIVRAYMASGEERAGLLAEADNMHVQLSARLERSGYNLMSRMFADAIHAVRARAQAAGRDRAALQAMLRELE